MLTNNDCSGEFVEMDSTILETTSHSKDELDAIGVNVSKKLARMEPLQALFAEYLINGILHKGLLNQLTEENDICGAGCNARRRPNYDKL